MEDKQRSALKVRRGGLILVRSALVKRGHVDAGDVPGHKAQRPKIPIDKGRAVEIDHTWIAPFVVPVRQVARQLGRQFGGRVAVDARGGVDEEVIAQVQAGDEQQRPHRDALPHDNPSTEQAASQFHQAVHPQADEKGGRRRSDDHPLAAGRILCRHPPEYQGRPEPEQQQAVGRPIVTPHRPHQSKDEKDAADKIEQGNARPVPESGIQGVVESGNRLPELLQEQSQRAVTGDLHLPLQPAGGKDTDPVEALGKCAGIVDVIE